MYININFYSNLLLNEEQAKKITECYYQPLSEVLFVLS